MVYCHAIFIFTNYLLSPDTFDSEIVAVFVVTSYFFSSNVFKLKNFIPRKIWRLDKFLSFHILLFIIPSMLSNFPELHRINSSNIKNQLALPQFPLPKSKLRHLHNSKYFRLGNRS